MVLNIESRTMLLIGQEGVNALRDTYAVVCGVGAVGGFALEGLVRAGIGHIKVVDDDSFDSSNLNRQILCTTDTIGKLKANVALERAKSINPSIDAEAVVCKISSETIHGILDPRPDILIDAIDTVEHKASLLRIATNMKIKTFSSMGAALHFSTQSIKVATLNKTKVCPLASSLRSRLKDINTDCITCVYSEEPVIAKSSGVNIHGKNVLGSLPTIPAVFGMTIANEVIRYIVKK